jgi:Domain of Unknown Function with PDB structure (DUF3857)/Transglutaminase-like superfamily
MNRLLIIWLCSLCFTICTKAQEKPEYNAALIPDSLKINANSVIRQKVVEMHISAPGKASVKEKLVITALNEKGSEELVFRSYQDNFSKLEFAEVLVYDALGNKLKKYKKKELEKVSVGDGFSVATDDKLYYLSIPPFTPPYTVEFNTEESWSGFLDLPDFNTKSYDASIQSSTCTITSTSDNRLRYKNLHTNITPVITENKYEVTWQWQINNVPAIKYEPGTPKRSNPRVLITSTYFELDHYRGEMTSWKSYGDWQNKLNEGAGNLTPERFVFFRNMVKDIPDTIQKIKTLYQYLQKNYRYVSIQLGIGGWKPFDAAYVDKNKFGDCKALSNFMHTLLAASGIRSHYAIINAGDDQDPVDPSFANNQFNHIILCVPRQKDSIWLECTSNDAPFGRLGSFTENRNALLITETGGQLVPTPDSKASDNIFAAYTHVILEADGSGKAIASIKHTGELNDNFKYYLWEQPAHRQKEYLIRRQGFKDFDEMTLEKETTETGGISKLQMHFEKIPDFAAGSKKFFRPHLYTVWEFGLPAEKTKRVNDFLFPYPFIETDTTTWQLPEGYSMESLPASTSFNFDLGSFKTEYKFDPEKKQVNVITRLELKRHRIPAAKYSEARIFFDRVLKELEQKIILKAG